jgi:hypothetical protein
MGKTTEQLILEVGEREFLPAYGEMGEETIEPYEGAVPAPTSYADRGTGEEE